MNRREFLTTGSAAAASLTGGIAAANAHAANTADARDVLSEPRRLSVALPWRDEIKGPGDIALRVLRRLEALSEGRLRFDIRRSAAGDAVPAADRSGEAPVDPAEITFGTEHDMVRHHPAFGYFAGLPGRLALDGGTLAHWLDAADGQSLWEELARPFGYRPLLCGHLGAGPRIFSRAPIHDAASIKGLAIYAPGLSARVAEGLGAAPATALDFADAPAAFAAGRIDAIETGALYQAMQMGLHKHGRHASRLTLTPAGSTVCMRVARTAWDGFSAAEQAFFQLAAREIYITTLTETRLHQDVIARALREQHGTTFSDPARDLEAATSRVSDAVVTHAAGHDDLARAIDGSYRAFRTRNMPSVQADLPVV